MQQIQLEKAIEVLLENTNILNETKKVNILDSLNYTLAEDIYSLYDNPPFNRSPLDGFSFNHKLSIGASKEKSIDIPVYTEIDAGDSIVNTIPSGYAVRIMTGAQIPDGCDCVLRQEEVIFDEEKSSITIYKELSSFDNYCFRGEDYKKGELILKKGELISYSHIGVLASLGIDLVEVYRKPKVGILSTGSELLSPGTPLSSGKIYNSNLYVLAAKLKDLGVDVISYSPLSDDVTVVSNFILDNLDEVDFLITTGGVSVGKMDIMHDVIERIGAKRLFWRVDIQPGTPVMASLKSNKIILSLSGNPFASFVNFELLGREILHKMSLGNVKRTQSKDAIVCGEFLKSFKKRRFIKAFYEDGKVYVENKNHASGMIKSTLNKNVFIDIPSGTDGIKAGDKVKVILID